jgi:hypothetical protein
MIYLVQTIEAPFRANVTYNLHFTVRPVGMETAESELWILVPLKTL